MYSFLRSLSILKYRAFIIEIYLSWWVLKLVIIVENLKILLIVLKFKFVCVDNIRWVKWFFGIDFGLKIGICS